MSAWCERHDQASHAVKDRNVVAFPRIDKGGPARRADTALIRECVIYAQSCGAYEAGFKADPDGNSAHTGPLGNHQLTRARQALVKISRMRATTAEGLQAKACIVPFFDDKCVWDDDRQAFVLSFAANVKALLEPIVDENWKASLSAEKDCR